MRLDVLAGGGDPDTPADPLVLTLAGVVVPCSAVGPVSIRHGRPSAEVRPEPSTCSVAFKVAGLAAWPAVGARLVVDLSTPMLTALGLSEAARRRFTGRVTDQRVTPSTGVVHIVAAGARSRAARVPIGDTPWPAELDGARAARILAELLAADPSFLIGVGDPGTVTVLARDVDRQPVGALLDDLGAYTGGDAWQLRDGTLLWRDAETRTDAVPVATLAARDVLSSTEATQSLDGLLTDLTVGYGLPVLDPVTGATAQATVRIIDTAAEDPATGHGFGSLSASVSTPLQSQADAQAYAAAQVGRRSYPRWRVPSLSVDVVRTLDPAQADALLSAEPGVLVELTGLPTTWPLPTGRMWIEGWAEEITRLAWRMVLQVTAYGLTGAAPRWLDVPDTYQAPAAPGGALPAPVVLSWNSPAVAGLSWLGAVAWWPGEDVDAGRYADVPANLRWNTYPNTLTWSAVA